MQIDLGDKDYAVLSNGNDILVNSYLAALYLFSELQVRR